MTDDKTANVDKTVDAEGNVDVNSGKVKVVPGPNEHAATFIIKDEDHTLANIHSPEVEFCGYSMPHPSENKVNIRVQTFRSSPVSAITALLKGLDDLGDLCTYVLDAFDHELLNGQYEGDHPDTNDKMEE